MSTALDLTQRTYQTAAHFAMQAAKRPDGTLDREKASRELARLLCHVRADDGGFQGLADAQLMEKWAADRRLPSDFKIITEFMWAPGQWPTEAQAFAQAAE